MSPWNYVQHLSMHAIHIYGMFLAANLLRGLSLCMRISSHGSGGWLLWNEQLQEKKLGKLKVGRLQKKRGWQCLPSFSKNTFKGVAASVRL